MNAPLFPPILVNGSTISAADIAAEAQNQQAPKGKPGLAWRKAARALIIRHLLLAQAQELAVKATPTEIAPGKFETEEEAQIRAVLDHALTPDAVETETLRAIYDRDPGNFRAPTLYQPSHILFSGEDAQIRAEVALKTLLKSPRDFAALASRESDCGSKEAGGQLGQLSSGDTVPEFEAVMRIAEEGQIHPELVKTRYGLHILRMDARADGDILPFESVQPRLRDAAEKSAWTHAAQAYVAGLLDAADIQGIDLSQPF